MAFVPVGKFQHDILEDPWTPTPYTGSQVIAPIADPPPFQPLSNIMAALNSAGAVADAQFEPIGTDHRQVRYPGTVRPMHPLEYAPYDPGLLAPASENILDALDSIGAVKPFGMHPLSDTDLYNLNEYLNAAPPEISGPKHLGEGVLGLGAALGSIRNASSRLNRLVEPILTMSKDEEALNHARQLIDRFAPDLARAVEQYASHDVDQGAKSLFNEVTGGPGSQGDLEAPILQAINSALLDRIGVENPTKLWRGVSNDWKDLQGGLSWTDSPDAALNFAQLYDPFKTEKNNLETQLLKMKNGEILRNEDNARRVMMNKISHDQLLTSHHTMPWAFEPSEAEYIRLNQEMADYVKNLHSNPNMNWFINQEMEQPLRPVQEIIQDWGRPHINAEIRRAVDRTPTDDKSSLLNLLNTIVDEIYPHVKTDEQSRLLGTRLGLLTNHSVGNDPFKLRSNIEARYKSLLGILD